MTQTLNVLVDFRLFPILCSSSYSSDLNLEFLDIYHSINLFLQSAIFSFFLRQSNRQLNGNNETVTSQFHRFPQWHQEGRNGTSLGSHQLSPTVNPTSHTHSSQDLLPSVARCRCCTQFKRLRGVGMIPQCWSEKTWHASRAQLSDASHYYRASSTIIPWGAGGHGAHTTTPPPVMDLWYSHLHMEPPATYT